MRVDGDLYESAKSTGTSSSRSAAQQINHWARIGRELEASPAVSVRDIQRVLAGDELYDALSERAQAIVRAAWDVRADSLRSALDFRAEFASEGRSWSELDDDGNVVVRSAE